MLKWRRMTQKWRKVDRLVDKEAKWGITLMPR